MMLAPFDKERRYDAMFEQVVKCVDRGLKNDDDFLLICGGDPGSGKTSLSMHAQTLYLQDKANVTQIAMTPKDFATVLNTTSKMESKRYLCYDEANVSKRQAMTKWNTKLIDLYMNIRGLNIFHWWNNPSVEMLDKPFIEERVKGLIFITTKDKKKPRLYMYFTKDGLLQLLEDHKNLKKRTIIKNGAKYAMYLGWFRDYKGPLLDEYKKMKHDRMHEKVSQFKQEFAPTDGFNPSDYTKMRGIDRATTNRIVLYAIESGTVEEGTHYTKTGMGRVIFNQKGIDQLDYVRINHLHNKRLKKNKQIWEAVPKSSIKYATKSKNSPDLSPHLFVQGAEE